MREIKFRAWHKEEKVLRRVEIITIGKGAFVYGVNVGRDSYAFVGEGDEKRPVMKVKAPEDGRFCYLEEIELMQYAGLKDKNGREIYEGDIMKRAPDGYEPRLPFIVFWSEKVCAFMLRNEPQSWSEYITDRNLSERFEVIGNIYENANLLESK